MEAAAQVLKKGKSAGGDNIPAELVQAGGRVSRHRSFKERQPSAVSELPNDQPHQSPKQSHPEDHTEQIEATSGEDLR